MSKLAFFNTGFPQKIIVCSITYQVDQLGKKRQYFFHRCLISFYHYKIEIVIF